MPGFSRKGISTGILLSIPFQFPAICYQLHSNPPLSLLSSRSRGFRLLSRCHNRTWRCNGLCCCQSIPGKLHSHRDQPVGSSSGGLTGPGAEAGGRIVLPCLHLTATAMARRQGTGHDASWGAPMADAGQQTGLQQCRRHQHQLTRPRGKPILTAAFCAVPGPRGGIGIHSRLRACARMGMSVRVRPGASAAQLPFPTSDQASCQPEQEAVCG